MEKNQEYSRAEIARVLTDAADRVRQAEALIGHAHWMATKNGDVEMERAILALPSTELRRGLLNLLHAERRQSKDRTIEELVEEGLRRDALKASRKASKGGS